MEKCRHALYLEIRGGENLNKKILLSTLISLFAIGVMAVPVFAAPIDTLAVHAAVEGRAIVRTGMGRPVFFRDAVMTFWTYTPSGTVSGHTEPGWAITLTVGGTLYVWHVTSIRTCGRSRIVIIKADPHPLPGVEIAIPGPSSIRIILNHDADRLFVVATGIKVFFIGNTLA